MRRALVLGGGGFIGSHLAKRLKGEGCWVRGVDLKLPRYAPTAADDFIVGDLRDGAVCAAALAGGFDEVYQLAADMGGAGFIFTGVHDADIMHNSAQINLNVLHACARIGTASDASSTRRRRASTPSTISSTRTTRTAAKAAPTLPRPTASTAGRSSSASGSTSPTRATTALEVRIARFHNIFGPEGSWNDGREKVPAALCRKVAMAAPGGEIEIWGDGLQTRSFLYIDECLDGALRLMRSDCAEPLNIGSEEIVSIDRFARMIMKIAGRTLIDPARRWAARRARPPVRQSPDSRATRLGAEPAAAGRARARPTDGSTHR